MILMVSDVSEDVPVVSLNFSSLSADSPYERHCVEGCVRKTVLVLLRAASSLPSVAHTFPRIGVLTFQQSRVKMIFYRDFHLGFRHRWETFISVNQRELHTVTRHMCLT